MGHFSGTKHYEISRSLAAGISLPITRVGDETASAPIVSFLYQHAHGLNLVSFRKPGNNQLPV